MNRSSPVRARTRDIASDPRPTTDAHEIAVPIEARLADVQRQLDGLKSQVRQAQQLASLGTVAATIAHEVNNLLTPIRSYAQAALEASPDDSLREKALRVTVRNVEMVTAMAERILEIGAATTRDRVPVPVETIARQARESLCRDLSKDGIRFRSDVDPSIQVLVDPLQIRQVLFNLFLNARNIMAPLRCGRIAVTAEQAGDRVNVKVSDDGPGIDPDLIDHIFNPLETSKIAGQDGKQRCAGLGLALCRDLIRENHGTITVESRLGEGTTFTLNLPAA